jgi:hypothetical protein
MSGDEAIVINRLVRWARWVLNSGVNLGYPSQVSFYRMASMTGRYHDPSFDSECQQTEKAVRSLPVDQYLLIRHEYIITLGWSKEEKAEYYHIKPRMYRYWIKDAHRQVAINLGMAAEVEHKELETIH